MIWGVPRTGFPLEKLPQVVASLVQDLPEPLPLEDVLELAKDNIAHSQYLDSLQRVHLPFSGDWVRGEGDWPVIEHRKFGQAFTRSKLVGWEVLQFDSDTKRLWESYRFSNDFQALASEFVYSARALPRTTKYSFADFGSIGVFVADQDAEAFFRNRIPHDIESWPICVENEETKERMEGFYLIAQVSVVTALDLEKSALKWMRDEGGARNQFVAQPAGPIYFDPERLNGHELFQDRALPNAIYISSNLERDMEAAGVKRP